MIDCSDRAICDSIARFSLPADAEDPKIPVVYDHLLYCRSIPMRAVYGRYDLGLRFTVQGAYEHY
jgi:hypothetical protein